MIRRTRTGNDSQTVPTLRAVIMTCAAARKRSLAVTIRRLSVRTIEQTRSSMLILTKTRLHFNHHDKSKRHIKKGIKSTCSAERCAVRDTGYDLLYHISLFLGLFVRCCSCYSRDYYYCYSHSYCFSFAVVVIYIYNVLIYICTFVYGKRQRERVCETSLQ